MVLAHLIGEDNEERLWTHEYPRYTPEAAFEAARYDAIRYIRDRVQPTLWEARSEALNK